MNLMRSPKSSDAFRLLWPARKGQLLFQEIAIPKVKGNRPRIFNLDLHVSVIKDLGVEFNFQNAELTQWSISRHNYIFRKGFRFPDPVGVVNARTWTALNDQMIDRFQDRYKRFLAQFDGFVSTHSPAFAQLFANTRKPTLISISTRYEIPYTDRPQNWKTLDSFLRNGILDGTLHVTANNLGDRDYFHHFVGHLPKIVPSVCDYQTPSPLLGNEQKVVLGRNGPALDAVLRTDSTWRKVRETYGKNYRWSNLASSQEVFVIPYNVSTMTLFELATAGTPVAVPGPELLKDLVRMDPSVLGELSFFKVQGISTHGLAPDDPNNVDSDDILDWWISRADFYNAELMPNVRVVESWDELEQDQHDRRLEPGYMESVEARNSQLKESRRDLVRKFLEAL